MKTADHLEHLIDNENAYSAQAVPWYLVVTSGMAAGYMDLADQYAAGAHANKEHAAVFHAKMTEYRERASRQALRFAQNVDKLNQLAFGRLRLAFDLPKGDAKEPALLARIAAGVQLEKQDAEAAEILAVQHSVLMTACQAAGAPNDVAKAEVILGQGAVGTHRVSFGETIAGMLEQEATLYSRDKLNEPDTQAILKKRAASVRAEAEKTGGAKVLEVGTVADTGR